MLSTLNLSVMPQSLAAPTSEKSLTNKLSAAEARQQDGKAKTGDETALREAFEDFVGQTFYGQLIKSMRETVDKPAYFHGGRGEEVFQSQMDQILAEKMSDASAEQFAEPMFELFELSRRRS